MERFYYHLGLHYSQTLPSCHKSHLTFYYHLGLHYSQTSEKRIIHIRGFTTTWDYTTLKHINRAKRRNVGFTTTWDYTTLKHIKGNRNIIHGFTTTWDYTTLKPQISKRQVFRSEKWEKPPFSYGLEQHSDTTTEYPAAARRL